MTDKKFHVYHEKTGAKTIKIMIVDDGLSYKHLTLHLEIGDIFVIEKIQDVNK